FRDLLAHSDNTASPLRSALPPSTVKAVILNGFYGATCPAFFLRSPTSSEAFGSTVL
ncbi:Hypothetical predicted protein, partial [Pelobates cultripes]